VGGAGSLSSPSLCTQRCRGSWCSGWVEGGGGGWGRVGAEIWLCALTTAGKYVGDEEPDVCGWAAHRIRQRELFPRFGEEGGNLY
jgi:hypothetical protein